MLMSSYSQLMDLSQSELRKHAKDAGVKNYSNLSKHDLAEATISASSLHVKSEPGRANAAEEIVLPSTPEGRGGRARLHIVLRMQLLRLQPWQPRRTRSRRTTLGERRRPSPQQ